MIPDQSTTIVRWFCFFALLLGVIERRLPAAESRKIVLIAGKKSHGPEGNGIHDYPWSVKLLKVMLDNSNVRDQVRVEYHLDGWPQDESTLEDADTIVIISDGRDGDLYEEAPHLASDERVALVARQVARGCGLMTFHFSTFTPDKYADAIWDWTGGYFDWEEDGKKQWYSSIQHMDASVELPSADHPVARGVKPFTLKEEFYFNLRFTPRRDSIDWLLQVPQLPGRDPDGKIVAWARRRENGGRGFGTTCGHFYDNWKHDDFRKMMLNAIVWTAHVEPPAEPPVEGVQARFYSHDEITAALEGVQGTARATFDDRPIRVLMLAGNEAHKWHNWEKTTPALQKLLEIDARIRVDVAFDIEELGKRDLSQYQLIVQNYCNWHDGNPLSAASREAWTRYLQSGGGMILIHFANGAFHPSLPEAAAADWPEYRKMVRRVWNHQGQGEAQSGHDAFGPYEVQIAPHQHPITRGLGPFSVTDELYFRQDGSEPIEPLIMAKSKVTQRDEPLAWTYEYGRGRIFQTLLGHSEKTYESFEAAEMIRRAAAWVARRPVLPTIRRQPAEPVKPAEPAEPAEPPRPAPKGALLVPGRFELALDTRAGDFVVAGKAEYRQPPLTVECWALLRQKANYNILVAQELKSSSTHWELFTMAGSGKFTAYLPGATPDHVASDVDVTDGKWHHLAMTYEPDRVRLFVDGRPVADQVLRFGNPTLKSPGDGDRLAIGQLVGREIGCDGLIDELRISRGIRSIERCPDRAYAWDDSTIGLWHLDILDRDQRTPDDSLFKNHAAFALVEQAAAHNFVKDHWGVEAVGFAWTENDSRDSRWQQTELGAFLASTVSVPEGPIRKGLSIRLGENQNAAVCYDTELGRMRAAWTGDFLTLDPARYGLIVSPKIAGQVLWTQAEGSGWPGSAFHYRGMRRYGNRVMLSYQVDDLVVDEIPWFEEQSGRAVFSRAFQIAPRAHPLKMQLAELGGVNDAQQISAGRAKVRIVRGDQVICWELSSDQAELELRHENGKLDLSLKIPAGRGPLELAVGFWLESEANEPRPVTIALPRPDFASLRQPGPPLWNASIVTQGVVGKDDGPYVVDTLTLPFENPYRALFFVGGLDFFPTGEIALATVHGDVWRVQGVDKTLENLTWKRYATGLFQPLGLKIVDGDVYVLGRDQITRLVDLNADGEADEYHNFFNGGFTSAGGHDYVAGLETDREGNFYFLHATQGLVKVDRAGSGMEILATGFRNPVGLSVGPDDTITAAPQEGEWTPASNIIEVKKGGHYGYLGPRVTTDRPLGYDLPLCWIPRMTDNSSGGQIWVTSDSWGPLRGQLLHCSFGKCRLMLALREPIEAGVQGGVIDFPLQFDSGLMRGRFSPHDGQLYLGGMKGWVTSAVQDGCLQRVRYTGRPVTMPIAVRTYRNGMAITFANALEGSSSEDPDNYNLEAWNYRYSKDYGSPDLKPSDPLAEGHDEIDVRSATLLDDGRTVFLEIPGLQPVHQLRIAYQLRAQDGSELRDSLHYSIHSVGSREFDESLLHRVPRAGRLPVELEARLTPGVHATFKQGLRVDHRMDRMVALHLEPRESVSSDLTSGPLSAVYEGYLRSNQKGAFRFVAEFRGRVELKINDDMVLQGDAASITTLESAQRIDLRKGYNRIELRYDSWMPDPTGDLPVDSGEALAHLRLLWEGASFALEPVPATAFFCDRDDPSLASASMEQMGKELFLTHRCAACHSDMLAPAGSLESLFGSPDLLQLGQRLEPNWVARWIFDPVAVRNDSRMPRVLAAQPKIARQQAADLAIFLTSIDTQLAVPRVSAAESTLELGERLFEELSCIACHRRNSAEGPNDTTRRSLAHVARKYRHDELPQFLQNPARHHATTRMPNFDLSDEEASALAAWIIAGPLADDIPWPEMASADPERGRRLFQDKCVQCHRESIPGINSPATVRMPLRDPHAGCLHDESPRESQAPRFGWTADQRHALQAYVSHLAQHSAAAVNANAAMDAPTAESRMLFRWLQCAACHPRDGKSSVRIPVLLEESSLGSVPEFVPNLTWAGEKLRMSWIRHILSDVQLPSGGSSRSRPWLKGRMPQFTLFAERLARGLVREHGLADEPVTAAELEAISPKAMAQIGNRLTTPAGLDCRQCHAVGAEQPRGDKGTQIALGINFAQVKDRLRPDFYHRFVLDPPRFEPNSKMPRLSDDGRTTKVKSILDGDARRQFDAVWHYIQSLP